MGAAREAGNMCGFHYMRYARNYESNLEKIILYVTLNCNIVFIKIVFITLKHYLNRYQNFTIKKFSTADFGKAFTRRLLIKKNV